MPYRRLKPSLLQGRHYTLRTNFHHISLACASRHIIIITIFRYMPPTISFVILHRIKNLIVTKDDATILEAHPHAIADSIGKMLLLSKKDTRHGSKLRQPGAMPLLLCAHSRPRVFYIFTQLLTLRKVINTKSRKYNTYKSTIYTTQQQNCK